MHQQYVDDDNDDIVVTLDEMQQHIEVDDEVVERVLGNDDVDASEYLYFVIHLLVDII